MSYTDNHRSIATETTETIETVETTETIETTTAPLQPNQQYDPFNDMQVHITISGKRYYAIPRCDGYFISRDGRVYSRKSNRELAAHDNGYGYFQVTIDERKYYVHRLVWETFRGPIAPGMTINHINHDSSDNRLTNLELVSQRENNNKKRCHEIIDELPDGAVELHDVEYRTPRNVYHFHDLHYYDHCVFERFSNDYRVIRPISQGQATVNSIKICLRKLLRLIEEQLQSEERLR